MISYKFIIFISFFLIDVTTSAQQLSSEKLDSTISIFWNPDLKVRVQVINPDEPDIQNKNSILTLYSLDQGTQQILFRDSIFAYTLLFKLMDLNGDGIKDLLVYNTNNGAENRSYHLYLVDQKLGRLTRVSGFEKVFNPYYDQKECLIMGFESFERKMIVKQFSINRLGNLTLAYREKAN
jgi:hypothetical protein